MTPTIPGPWLTRWKKLAAIRLRELNIPLVPGWSPYGWRFDNATKETFATIRIKAGLGHRPQGDDWRLDGKLRRYLLATPKPERPIAASEPPPFIDCDVPYKWPFSPGEPHYWVLHTTSGYGSVESLAAFFRQGVLGVQWAVDADGRIGRYKPGYVCNHVLQEREHCEGVEQVGFATGEREPNYKGDPPRGSLGPGHLWTGDDWVQHRRTQLDAVSRLIAYRCAQLKIPIVRAANGSTRGYTLPKGIVGHCDVPGNDHGDPGEDYPWDLVLGQAKAWLEHGVPVEVETRLKAANAKRF